MAIAYHEVESSKLNNILTNGLKRTSRGSKGSDKDIIKTDKLLDKYRTENLRKLNVSRDNNLYAYDVVDNEIIDITNGNLIDVTKFINKSGQKIVKLTIDPNRCFVPDLDTYDKLKYAIKEHKRAEELEAPANEYWTKLIP